MHQESVGTLAKRVHPGVFQEVVRNIREMHGMEVCRESRGCCILLPSEVGILGPYWGAGQEDLVWEGHRLGFTQGGPIGGTYSEGSSTGGQ